MDNLKRILSLVLATALLLAYLPAVPLIADAEEYTEAEEAAAVDETTAAEETEAPETEPALQTEAAAQEERGTPGTAEITVIEVPFQVNPRYEGVLDASDFEQTQTQSPQVSLLSDYGTEAEAAVTIRENLKNRAETFTVYYASTNSAFEEVSHELFDAAISHTGVPTEGDYLAWQYGGWSSTISISSSGGVYYCTTTYTVSYYTTAAQEAEMDAAVDALLAQLNPTGSDYEKIRTVYDYICGNVAYDYDNLNDANYKLKYTAYGALINKTSVCQGYAVLLYRLALEMGIDCRLISGYGNSEAHGWNIIQLGNLYYNADATWDAGKSTYSYFLKSDANFGAHIRDEAYAGGSFYAAYPMSETDYEPDTASCGEDLTWVLDEEGTLTISGTGAMWDFSYEIDWTYGGVHTTIPWWNEENITAIKKVVVSEGVTTLGDYAFRGLMEMSEIELPDSLTQIGDWVFGGCRKLEQIELPSNVIKIGEYAFEGCNAISSITIPDKITVLNYGTFSYCTSLTTIDLPDGLTEIGDNAFESCPLETVAIPETVIRVGQWAFSNNEKLTEITIPASVKSIGIQLFQNCTNLKKITFLGDAPVFEDMNGEAIPEQFDNITAIVYYPANNDTWTADVMQDYGGTITWEAYTAETSAISQAEFEAAIIAAIEAGEESYALTKALTLSSDLTIGSDIMVTIEAGGSITVPSGITLTTACDMYRMTGEIIVENGGTLQISEYGLTTSTGGAITIRTGGNLVIAEDAYLLAAYQGKLTAEENANINANLGCIILNLRSGAVIEGVDNSQIYASYEIFVDDGTPMMDYIEEGSVYGSFRLRPLMALTQTEEVIEIPENTSFNICGFTIPEGMTVINHGTIEVEQDRLVVNGTLDNQGTILMYDEKMLEVNGSMTGNDATVVDLTMTQAQLQAKIDAALEASGEFGGLMGFSENVVLTSNMEIPADMDVEMIMGGITVSDSVTLTVNGNLSAYNYPYIIVKSGGRLIINGRLTASSSTSIIIEEGAQVQVNGTLNIRGDYFYDGVQTQRACYLTIADGAVVQVNGTMTVDDGVAINVPAGVITTQLSNAANITGIDGLFTVTSHPADGDELAACAAEGAAYRAHEITVDTAITLTGNTNIPNNTRLNVTGQAVTLTVPGGCTLTNAGSITLEDGTKLLVQENGTLTNRGKISGEVVTEGTVIEDVAEDLDNVVTNADGMTAEEIRTAVQDMNTEELAAEMTADASVLENIAALEEKTGGAAQVEADEACGFTSEQVSIVGANLNPTNTGETVKLVIAGAEGVEIPEEYDSENALVFSMTLEGAADPENLAVPVSITLPVPEGMDTENLVILHYHENGTMDVIEPTVSEKDGQYYASFVLTSFSDFVMTAAAAAASGSCGDGLSWAFDEASGTLTISGTGDMDAYTYATVPWDNYRSAIITVVLNQGVTSIGDFAFFACSSLESVTIPEGVTAIGNCAFQGCSSLTDITIPEGVASIGVWAFGECSNLTDINLPESITVISGYAFYDCSMTNIAIPEGVTSISEHAFAYCENLNDITIPNSVTDIGEGAFSGCSNLTDISLPERVAVISDYAFMDCSSLTGIAIPEGVTSIGWHAFQGCSSLTSITIPESVASIGVDTFMNCSGLTSITIPENVDEIGVGAFENCAGLTEIRFTGNAPTIYSDVFAGVTATAYYPDGDLTWTEEVRQDYSGTITWVSYGAAEVLTGDLNGDNVVDDGDVALLLWHTLFPESYGIAGNADFTSNGTVDDADVAYLLWHTLFPDTYPL